jgi:hypothetical protein
MSWLCCSAHTCQHRKNGEANKPWCVRILPCRLDDLEAEGEVHLITERWPMLEIW